MKLNKPIVILLAILTVSATFAFTKAFTDEELRSIELTRLRLREFTESEKWALRIYHTSLDLGLTYKQFVNLKWILAKLRHCESTCNDSAVNEKDLDGTASFGRYQFKPDTFYGWGMKYKLLPANLEKLEVGNFIMDGDLQEDILIRAIIENGSNKKWWQSQFPACSKKYNYWGNI